MLKAFEIGLAMGAVILLYNFLLWVILSIPVRKFIVLNNLKGSLLGLILAEAYAFVPMIPEFYLFSVIRQQMFDFLSVKTGSHEDELYSGLAALGFCKFHCDVCGNAGVKNDEE